MKLRVALITAILGFALIASQYQFKLPSIFEDDNANGIPDFEEMQIGIYKPHFSINMLPIVPVFTAIIFVISVFVAFERISKTEIAYRNDFDFFAKLFKSKMRGWCDVRKVVFAFLVLGCLLVLVSATDNGSIFSEDSDGDGLPDVVEEQVGTDPNDPLSCIYVQGISDAGMNETIIEIAK